MSEKEINFEKLKEPFLPTDIEWRVGRSGVKKNGEVWARVLAYVTNRSIMDRLDEVCGAANWRNEYKPGPAGGVVCGISIRVNGEWLTKWDGADNTDIESVKGGLSDSMKRAAVQWGIGRYLYNLESGWADICENGTHHDSVKSKQKGGDDIPFSWNPPQLPKWALPTGFKQEPSNPPAEKPQSNGTNGAHKPNGSTAANGKSGAKDPYKEWEGKIVTAKAPAQLRAMKNGIARDGKLDDEQKKRLQLMAENEAQRRETATATAGAPPG